jgi:hypothetical protein
MSNFEVRADEHGIGSVLILKKGWEDDVASYMLANNIFALRLTDSFGFKGQDLSFLSALTFLRSLEIYCWDARGISVIEAIPQLEVFGLQCKSSETVSFAGFSALKVAMVTWAKGLSSLLEVQSLEVLNVQNYPHENLQPISGMAKLKRLVLTSRKLKSLGGIERLKALEQLDLYNCPFLESLVGVESCPKLSSIEVEACNRVRA